MRSPVNTLLKNPTTKPESNNQFKIRFLCILKVRGGGGRQREEGRTAEETQGLEKKNVFWFTNLYTFCMLFFSLLVACSYLLILSVMEKK